MSWFSFDSKMRPFSKKTLIEIMLIYNVVVISAAQQSGSGIHTHTSFLFQILFPHRISQKTG